MKAKIIAVAVGIAALIFTAYHGRDNVQNSETETAEATTEDVIFIAYDTETTEETADRPETLSVNIENADKKGIIDDLIGKNFVDTHYERTPIGSMGRYIVELDNEIEASNNKWVRAWIEDEDGTDLYNHCSNLGNVLSSECIYVLDAKNEKYLHVKHFLHGDAGGTHSILNGDLKTDDTVGSGEGDYPRLTVEETENGMSAEEKAAQINTQ